MNGRCRAGRMVACLVLALLPFLSGCSTVRSIKSSLFGGEPAAETGEGERKSAPAVYYVGADGLNLYREPGKTVVARLPLGQKVYRYRLERGYAFVKVPGTGEEGWLQNAKLTWRPPSEQVTAPAPAAPPEPSADTAPPAVPPEPSADTAPPAVVDTTASPAPASGSPAAVAPAAHSSKPEGPTPSVSPSVFDPY